MNKEVTMDCRHEHSEVIEMDFPNTITSKCNDCGTLIRYSGLSITEQHHPPTKKTKHCHRNWAHFSTQSKVTEEEKRLQKFKHFKHGTIYTKIGETVPFDPSKHQEAPHTPFFYAKHHETQQEIRFLIIGNEFVNPTSDKENYVVYKAKDSNIRWVREVENFNSYKILEDGQVVRRFQSLDDDDTIVIGVDLGSDKGDER